MRQTVLSKAKQMAHLSVASMGWTRASLLELVTGWPTEIGWDLMWAVYESRREEEIEQHHMFRECDLIYFNICETHIKLISTHLF